MASDGYFILMEMKNLDKHLKCHNALHDTDMSRLAMRTSLFTSWG